METKSEADMFGHVPGAPRICRVWDCESTGMPETEGAEEIERLREALEPLAAMASRYDPEDGDGDLECWSGLAVPKIRHLRAARAALAGEGKR